jgi:uncharacterized repeat protein (TIGR01451 family)
MAWTPAPALAQDPDTAGIRTPSPDIVALKASQLVDWQTLAEQAAIDKIDPALQDAARNGGKDTVTVSISFLPGADVAGYLDRAIVRPAVLKNIQRAHGVIKTADLLKIASDPNVLAVVDATVALRPKSEGVDRAPAPTAEEIAARLAELKANEVPWSETSAGQVAAQGWFDVKSGHQSSAAWQKGFEGQGVIVGVLDDGIDFAHPDLQGTYAVNTDPASPYYGWPMAFSQLSMTYWVEEVWYQNLGALGITGAWNGSMWADTQTTQTVDLDGKVWYQPVGAGMAYAYEPTGTSLSGEYKLGSLNDQHLIDAYGQRVAILVVDEGTAGVYDTVYIDLDHDYDFTDEKPVTKDSPEAYRDMDGDGYADISGGLLVWIADGANLPPMVDWLWGVQPGDEAGTLKALPDGGELLIFTGPFDAGYSHGTQCASAVAAQGVVSDGLTAQPFAEGGMVQGAAPKVGLMDFANHYYSGTDEDEYLVVALGYDGIPNSGDEVQVASNSYGSFRQMWGGWGYFGRLITAINLDLAPTSVWLFSAGNEGPGYGPQEGDGGPTIITVGTSTQYGSTNWDSIESIDQIVYGDVSNWYSHGPNNDGSVGVDVLTNGGRGSGDEALNYYGFYGAESWATWGGTSRSAPAAAGNLALIYQAYKARHGEWPTWDVAKALFKSTANDASGSPFLQGGGVVNADRGTDVAAGLYGVYTMPDAWQVGGWEGEQYLNFASVTQPGEVWEQEFTVINPGGFPIKVGLDDAVMVKYDEMEIAFTTSYRGQESSFNFHSPDYLVPLNPADIPADAELMVVRYVHPYSTFDASYDFTANPDSSWRFLLYNWTDQNGDGLLWEDLNGNGVVNHVGNGQWDNDGFERIDFANSEIQEGEYVRMDYSFGGIALPFFVRDPLERMADGYFFGFQHRYNNGTVDTTTFKIGVEFYKRADWDWLTLSTDKLLVPAEGEATFEAQMAIPANAAPGTYEGIILVSDPGNFLYKGHETALPIIVNVMADLPDNGALSLGFGARDDLLYQNGWYNGYFNWYGGGWTGAGDWRRWFINVDEADLENNRLLFHTSWSGGYPTDWNTWVLGPKMDFASNGIGPSPWYDFILDQPNQDIYGPYTLAPLAWSEPFQSGAVYPFSTSSGGPDDWVVAMPTLPGLYEVAIHNVLADGEALWEQVGVEVGTIDLEAYMDPDEGEVTIGSIDAVAYDTAGQIELNFTPTLAIPDMVVSLAGGLTRDDFGPYTVFIVDNGEQYSPWLGSNTVESFTVDQAGATQLVLHLEMPPGQDADMFLVRDNNGDGVATAGTDTLVGSSGNATGTDEEIVLANPAMGDYLAVFCGYNVEPNAGADFDWWWNVTYPGGLPSDEVDAYNGPAQLVRRVWDDPTTAEFTTVVVADERAGALHVEVTGIPIPEIADLWVLDAEGTKLAQSVMLGQADEHLVIYPPAGQYRFEPGTAFTIVIYDKKIQVDPPLVQLRAWWDHLNLWLSTDDPNVTAMSIDAGEAARVYVNYDKPGWAVGDPDLSARVIAGPTVLPMAFDELLTIKRVDEPGDPVWDPDNLLISIMPDSDRGFLPGDAKWWFGGTDPIPTALIGPGEWVTYTVHVENTDVVESDELYVDTWPLPHDYFAVYGIVPATNQVHGVDYELLAGPGFDYGSGIDWQGTLGAGEALEFSYRVQMPAVMAPGKNHTSGVDVYLGTSYLDEWFGWAPAGAWNRPVKFLADKWADAYYVYGGDQLTYTIELQAIAGQDQEVWVEDTLPAEVTFVSATGGATYDGGSHTVSWPGWLPGSAYETVTLDIVVDVAAGLPYERSFLNEAALYTDPEGAPVKTMAWECVVDSAAWLDIDKTADKRWALPGQAVGFTITMANLGTDPALGVVMSDIVPDGFILDGGSAAASKASAGPLVVGNEIMWEGDIAVGEVVTVTFTATVSPEMEPGMVLINGAEAVADNFPWRVYDGMPLQVLRSLPKWLPVKLARFWIGIPG